jgi:dTDP-4-dehydrorhamnose 3,5-epimerase
VINFGNRDRVSFNKTALEGVLELFPQKFVDERGMLYERFSPEVAVELGFDFIQENVSVSKKGVIRGLHWQTRPNDQGKLVTCVHGEIYDVAVDIRKFSPTFGKHLAVQLSGRKGNSLWIPSGFAHGFQALTEEVVVTYSVTSKFEPLAAAACHPLDQNIAIKWPIVNPILSRKDSAAEILERLSTKELF